jgi:hypothetical protein
MPSFRHYTSLVVLLLLACGSEPRASQPKPPNVGEAFSQLPLPPNPEYVSQAGSSDALQISVHSPADIKQVTEHYRELLSSENWRLVSDRTNPDGSTVLYAEQDGPPLWVRIWKPARGGTMVELTGAVVDSTKSKRTQSAPVGKQGK